MTRGKQRRTPHGMLPRRHGRLRTRRPTPSTATAVTGTAAGSTATAVTEPRRRGTKGPRFARALPCGVLVSPAMTRESRRVGRFEITAIVDADMPDEPIEDAFPSIPAAELRAAKASFPGLYTDDDRWRLRVRAWVVRHDGGLLLLDTGIGDAASPPQEWASQTGALTDELEQLDIAVDDIATVV